MHIIDKIRDLIRDIARHIAAYINKLSGGKISPNSVTLSGLALHLPIAALIVSGHNFWAAIGLLVFGMFDTFDGELARLQNRTSSAGMFLDSVSDRLKEIILYLSMLWVLANSGNKTSLIIIAATMAISICITYANAWGEVVLSKAGIKNKQTNKLLRTGIASYDIRMFLIFLGLLTNHMLWAIYVIFVLGSWTLGVRILNVFSILDKGSTDV